VENIETVTCRLEGALYPCGKYLNEGDEAIPLFIVTTSDLDSKLLEALEKKCYFNYKPITLVPLEDAEKYL